MQPDFKIKVKQNKNRLLSVHMQRKTNLETI